MSDITQYASPAGAMLLDPEGWENSLPQPTRDAVRKQMALMSDPAAARKRLGHISFLSEKTGYDRKFVRDNYEAVRSSYGVRNGLGDAWKDDATFSVWVTDRVASERDENVMLAGSREQTIEGSKLREASMVANAYSEGVKPGSNLADSYGAWNITAQGTGAYRGDNAGRYVSAYSQIFNEAKQDLAIAQEAAANIFPIIQDEAGGSDPEEALPFLRPLTARQQALVFREIGELNKTADAEKGNASKGFGGDFILSGGRAIEGIFRGLGNMWDSFQAEGNTGNFDEEQPEDVLADQLLVRRLVEARQGIIHPISNEAISEKMANFTAQSLPTMAAMMVPAGWTAVASAYANDAELTLVENGVPPDKARLLAGFIGPAQARLDKLELGLLVKAPLFAGLKQRINTNAVAMAGGRLAGIVAGEAAIEVTQDTLLPAGVQAVAHAWDSTIPGVKSEEIWGDMKSVGWDALVGSVPLAMLGVGFAHARDVKGADRIARDVDAMVTLGFTPSQIAAVQMAPEGEAVKVLREIWPERTPGIKGDSKALTTGEAAGVLDEHNKRLAEEAEAGQVTTLPGSATPPGESAQIGASQEQLAPQSEPESGAPSGESVEIPVLRRDDQGWNAVYSDGRTVQLGDAEAAIAFKEMAMFARDEASAKANIEIINALAEQDKATGDKTQFDFVPETREAVLREGQASIQSRSVNSGVWQQLETEPMTLKNLAEEMEEAGVEKAKINGANWLAEDIKKIEVYEGSRGIFTVLHERVESLYKAGRISKEETQAAARALLPALSGDKELAPKLQRIADGTATEVEARETMVDLFVSEVGLSGRKTSGLPAGAMSQAIRGAIQSNAQRNRKTQAGLSRFARFIRAVRTYMRNLFRAAAQIRKARREGQDLTDFDAAIDKLVGRDTQRREVQATLKEAEGMGGATMSISPEDVSVKFIGTQKGFEGEALGDMYNIVAPGNSFDGSTIMVDPGAGEEEAMRQARQRVSGIVDAGGATFSLSPEERMEGSFDKLADGMIREVARTPRRASEYFRGETATLNKGAMQVAIQMIDAVHGMGSAGVSPVSQGSFTDPKQRGLYKGGEITLSSLSGRMFAVSTAVHEVGHKMDFEVFQKLGDFDFEGYTIYGRLLEQLRATPTAAYWQEEREGYRPDYMGNDIELVARAYTQYVFTKSGFTPNEIPNLEDLGKFEEESPEWFAARGRNNMELGRVERINADTPQARVTEEVESRHMWPAEEFAPIAQAFDELFQYLNLASPTQGATFSISEDEMTVYRAGDATEQGIKPWASFSEDRATAEAYQDNPGFGGETLREERVVRPRNTFVMKRMDRREFDRLAEAIGMPEGTGDDWFDSGYRYPWEESSKVKRAIEDSDIEAIEYEDDFPAGARTIVFVKPPAVPKQPATFSISPAEDAEYLQAVESGNMQKAQAMVDRAAKASGYTIGPVYHGTNTEFSAFDESKRGQGTAEYGVPFMFFSDSREVAEEYSLVGSPEYRTALVNLNKSEDEYGEFVYQKLGATNTSFDREVYHNNTANKKFDKGEISLEELQEFQRRSNAVFHARKEVEDTRDKQYTPRVITAYLKIDSPVTAEGSGQGYLAGWDVINVPLAKEAEESGADGFIAKDVIDSPFGSDISSTVYAVRSPEQIKSADPVTRDVQGNIIPLSQRFNPRDNRITFSISPAEEIAEFEARIERAIARDPKKKEMVRRNTLGALAKLKAERIAGVSEDRTKVSLDREQRFRLRMRQRELVQGGMSVKLAEAEAALEAEQWRKERDALQRQDWNPRAILKRSAQTLNAIYSNAPLEVRGRLKGWLQIIDKMTPEAQAEVINERIDRLGELLESYYKKEYGEDFEKLLSRAKPVKGKPGEKPRGKIGPEGHALFRLMAEAREWDEAKTLGEISGRQSAIDAGELSPEDEARMAQEIELIQLFSDWKNADSARRAAAVDAARRIFEAGYLEQKGKLLAQREEDKKDREAALVDANTPADPVKLNELLGEQQEKSKSFKGRWRDRLMNLFDWRMKLEVVFGENSRIGRMLEDMERDAAFRKEDLNQALADDVEAFFTAMGGGALKGDQLRYRMSQPSIKNSRGYQLSEMDGVSALLMWRQEKGRKDMEAQGDDAAFIKDIQEGLTPEGRAFYDFVSSIYGAEHAIVNPKYREAYGVDLPKNDLYAPLTKQPGKIDDGMMADPITGAPIGTASIKPASFITRRSGPAGTVIYKNALQVLLAHKAQINHWLAYVDFARKAQAVLGRSEVYNAMVAKAGKSAADSILKDVQGFAGAGYQDAAGNLAVAQLARRLASRAATIHLAGNIASRIIQSTQAGAALMEMPTTSFVKRFLKLWSGQMDEGLRDALRSEFMQRRLKELPPIVREVAKGYLASRPNRARHLSAEMMKTMGGTDVFFTSSTYAIIKDYRMALGRREGLSGEALEQYATREAIRGTERVAQPTRMGTRSTFENTQNAYSAFIGAYISDARQKAALAAYNLLFQPVTKANLGQKLRTAVFVWGIGGIMANVLRSAWRDFWDDDDEWEWDPTNLKFGFNDDKNWNLQRMMAASVAGPVNVIPFVGQAMEDIASYLVDAPVHSGNIVGNIGSAANAAQKLASSEFYKDADEPVEETMKQANSLMAGLGFFSDTLAAAASISKLVTDTAKVMDAVYSDEQEDILQKAAAQRRKDKEAEEKADEAKSAEQRDREEQQKRDKKQRKLEQDARRFDQG